MSESLYNKTIFSSPTYTGDNLGNIRTTHIKSTAIELVKIFPDRFVPKDFEKNKASVDDLVDMNNKYLRNKIAGYITRYLSNRKKSTEG
jgi:small subunit ribosomal protein S17e